MKTILQFKDKLVALMTELTSEDASQPFSAVVGFNDPELEDFPLVQVVQLDGGTMTRFQSKLDLVGVDYLIRGIWSMEAYDQDVEDKILEAQQAVIDKFLGLANIDTLDGVADRFTIISYDRFAAAEDEPYIGFTFHVRATNKGVVTQ